MNETNPPPPIQKHVFVLIGADTYRVIEAILRTGRNEPEPKSVLIRNCFHLSRKESNVEYAKMPGVLYPTYCLKTPVDDQELFAAKMFATSRKFRVGEDEQGLFLSLGFSPQVLGEAQ